VTLLAGLGAAGAQTSAADGPSCYSRLTNEWICGEYVQDFRPEIQAATIEHLQITALSVLLGVLLAFPLALLARRYARLESSVPRRETTLAASSVLAQRVVSLGVGRSTGVPSPAGEMNV